MVLEKQLVVSTDVTSIRRKYTPQQLEFFKREILKKEETNCNYSAVINLSNDWDDNDYVLVQKNPSAEKIAFKYFNPTVDEDSLFLDIEILDTCNGKMLSSLMEMHTIIFRTLASGYLKGIPDRLGILLEIPELQKFCGIYATSIENNTLLLKG